MHLGAFQLRPPKTRRGDEEVGDPRRAVPRRDEGEPARAGAGQRALGDPAGETGRDARIDRVSALLEDARAGPGGERVTGCNRALHEYGLTCR